MEISHRPEKPGVAVGCVVLYSPEESGFRRSHDRLTRIEIARRIAALIGLQFGGEYDPSACYPAGVYFVPSDTIIGVEAARQLGICTEHDLFGVVPWPFAATKAITHPVVDPDACAPAGWSHELARRVRDAVPLGFSVFSLQDASRAARRLLEQGPVRIKPVRSTGGRAQSVADQASDIEDAVRSMETGELTTYGVVLEENLTNVMTYSVGQVRVAGFVASYCGIQHTTPDNSGAAVYGGSDLLVARGNFETLLTLALPEEVRLAIAQARTYEAAAMECLPGTFASRRNYDVAQGLNAKGVWRSGVLEQSWRVGGASSAELVALETFRSEPELQAVRTSSVEVYAELGDLPPNATLLFRGVDDQVGPITKYTLVRPL